MKGIETNLKNVQSYAEKPKHHMWHDKKSMEEKFRMKKCCR